MFKGKKIIKFTLHFKNNTSYGLLEDILIFKRYMRRRFNYFISFSVQTSNKIKQKKIVLLRSPFVHKKTQEHFLIKYENKKLNFFFLFSAISLYKIYWILAAIKIYLKKLSNSFYKINYFFLLNK